METDKKINNTNVNFYLKEGNFIKIKINKQ